MAMSSTKTETALPVSPKKDVKTLLQDTRIDAAHLLKEQDPGPTPPASAYSELPIADSAADVLIHAANDSLKHDIASEQLQRQAEQLAEYLRDRQKELDHREAQLNVEIAQLESDIRNARLWLSERESEEEQRRQELDVREMEFLERLDRLAAADAALQRQTVAKAAESPLDITDREEQIRRNAAVLRQRQRELEEAENHLAQAQAETQKFHEQLMNERQELREEINKERQRFIVQQRQALGELEKKHQVLQRRSEHMDQFRAALMQLRAELQQMHRETLEFRLATEELWIHLSGAAPPAALTHSLGRIRNRLAEQYRLANSELVEQKKEIKSIRDQLIEQYDKLVEQKRQFERWMECKQGESEQEASMLIAREQAILQQQTRFEEDAERWQVERMRYGQEIRRLRLRISELNEQTASV